MAIRELTPQDWEVANKYREECRRFSTDTTPANFERAKEIISILYSKMGWTVKNWVILESPYAAKQWILKNRTTEHLNTNFYGNQELYWVYFLKFARDHLKVDIPEDKLELIDLWDEICHSVGWWFVIDQETCVLCGKATSCQVDDQQRLHNPSGYALVWADGWGVCCYNGLYIPEEMEKYILDNSLITIDIINSIDNADLRRVLVDIMGHSNYLNGMEMELIAADYIKVTNDPDSPSMPRFLMRSKLDQSQYLVGTDGSTNRVYYMEVDPESTTCEAAHNSISPFQESSIIASS